MREDRDQLFEQALARHLRTGGAAESVCLDPEILAAYHERTLSPEELAFAKSHIVGCARCQSVLAQLEATETVDEVHDTEQADVPALVAAGVSMQVHPQPVSFESKSSATSAASSKVVSLSQKKYFSLRWVAPAAAIAAALLIWIGVRDSAMKTITPASVQVAENRQQAPGSPAKEESKDLAPPKELEKQKAVAPSADQLNEAARSLPPAAAPEPSLRDEKKDYAIAGKPEEQDKRLPPRLEYQTQTRSGMAGGRGPSAAAAQAQANNALQRADQGVAGGAAQMAETVPAPTDLDKAEPQKNQPALAAKSARAGGLVQLPAPPPPPPKAISSRLRGTVTDPSGAAVAGARVELKSADGAPVASTSTDASGTYSFTGVTAGEYQLQLQSPGFKADTLTALSIAPGDNVMNAKLEIGSSAETVQVIAQAPVIDSQMAEVTAAPERKERNLQALLLSSSGLQTVASPDGNAVWKFGDAGRIFHSKNAGKEWTSQASGVSVKLLAASAPTAKVCWIAGAAGTLLLTTNGGKHWQRVVVPIAGDLGGVHASDARHASIWGASNHHRYETSDGGDTWKQTANE